MMYFQNLLIVILASLHLVLAFFHVYDLFTKSRRNQKFLWMIFLLTVPIISFFIYRNTMKRHRNGSLF
jgi:uncharacterized membrane protein